MIKFVLALLLGLPSLALATAPTLPQLSVDITDPSVAGYGRTVDCTSSAGNAAAQATCLNTAITNAQYGDLIQTEPGVTLDKNLTLGVPGGSLFVSGASRAVTSRPATTTKPATSTKPAATSRPATTAATRTNFVTIRPTGFDSAVAIGTRATSAHTANMTTIRSATVSGSTSDAVISASTGAKHWWLSGLELIPKAGTFSGNIVNFQPATGGEDPSNQTSYMFLDRVYIHGDTSGTNGGPGTVRGAFLNGTYTAVINSTIDDIKTTDAQGDSQTISMAYGAGPVHIENNLLGATSEDVLFETNTGETVGGITYTGNASSLVTTGTIFYDAVGKTINLAGTPGTTATISSIQANTPDPGKTTLQLSGALSASDFSGTAYIAYLHDASFFPGDIKILRNHFRKKDAWNIAHASYERTSGSDLFGPSNFSLTIDASNDFKATNVIDFSIDHVGRQIYITGGTGFVTGYAYIVSVAGNVATFNRDLGDVGSTGGTARLKYAVKNKLEFKSGARILVEGNVFEKSWNGGQSYALAWTPRYTNSPAGDLTFQYNVVKDVYSIATITASEVAGSSGGLTPPPWLKNSRVTLKHNLFKDVQNDVTVANPLWAHGGASHMMVLRIYNDTGTTNGANGGQSTLDDFVFEHNTVAGASTSAGSVMMQIGDGNSITGLTAAKRFVFRNNIVYCGGASGLFSSALGPTGSSGFNGYTLNSTADARAVTKNICFGTATTGSDYTDSVDLGNVWLANEGTINFTNYAGGDYSIASGTYDNWGSDGTDPGADIVTLNTKISGVAP